MDGTSAVNALKRTSGDCWVVGTLAGIQLGYSAFSGYDFQVNIVCFIYIVYYQQENYQQSTVDLKRKRQQYLLIAAF